MPAFSLPPQMTLVADYPG